MAVEAVEDDCGCKDQPVQPCECVDGEKVFPKIPSNG